jgi:GxxExxY protein
VVISVPAAVTAKRMKMFKEEGYKLMGAAFEVYNELGYGMAEEVYQQSLEIELALRGIPSSRSRR